MADAWWYRHCNDEQVMMVLLLLLLLLHVLLHVLTLLLLLVLLLLLTATATTSRLWRQRRRAPRGIRTAGLSPQDRIACRSKKRTSTAAYISLPLRTFFAAVCPSQPSAMPAQADVQADVVLARGSAATGRR